MRNQYFLVIYLVVIENPSMATRSDAAIRDADNRRVRLRQWIDEHFGGSQAAFVAAHKLNQGEISSLLKDKSFGSVKARNLETLTDMPERYLDDRQGSAPQFLSTPASTHEAQAVSDEGRDLVITQYDVGGAMGNGGKLILDAEQPGIIKSWRVDQEWLRLNVPAYTSVSNLCIVTGFGSSMKPIFNPGDPLLMDRGVNHVDHEGIYFFRLGDEGFIKIIQRVPNFDKPGFVLRIISKNKEDFPPYDISAKHPDFHVIGKILTVWRSEQY